MEKNTLFIVAAPSGSGKTTIMRSVMDNEIVSFTTRAMRDNEKDGVDYLFIDTPTFLDLQANGGLIEETNYSGNHYGITSEEFYGKLDKGNAFIIVDVNGLRQLKKMYDKCVTIFIYTTKEDAIQNMLGRGDSSTNVDKRLATFDQELDNRMLFDYVISNPYGKMMDTINIVQEIVNAYANLLA
jgi:guanylate kinase